LILFQNCSINEARTEARVAALKDSGKLLVPEPARAIAQEGEISAAEARTLAESRFPGRQGTVEAIEELFSPKIEDGDVSLERLAQLRRKVADALRDDSAAGAAKRAELEKKLKEGSCKL
jgi:hypothetical protein